MQSDPRALEKWRERSNRTWRSLLRPPPRLSLSDWSDEHRILQRESSPEPGRWRTDRIPYLRGIMDAISRPGVRRVCWVAASQTGKTETINNFIGYRIHLDPGPMLFVHYSEKNATEWSKERFAPMIRDMSVLRERVGDPKSRTSGDTILHKQFTGGHITAVGTNSPANLSARPVRDVVMDEVDRYEASTGQEGDPFAKAEQRTRAFTYSKKVIAISSPTADLLEDEDHADVFAARPSRIQREWVRSDQRFYFVPCPHCNHMQVLFRPGEKWTQRIIWETEEREDGTKRHRPETAAYLCRNCACLVEERDKAWMLERGEWRATNPEGEFPGFHLSGLYSVWDRWADLARDFLASKEDRELLKQFVNERLADWWRELPSDLKVGKLAARAEKYPEGVDVPNGVGILTAGVDVHDDRLELKVKGWGEGEESWLIGHHRIYGDPEADETWARLEHFRTRPYVHESGAELRIMSMCIDAGHLTDTVYAYVKPRESQGVYAVKGMHTRRADPLKRSTRKNRHGVKLWTIGTYEFKDVIFRRLAKEEVGPGYMHFCSPTKTGADAEYFKQFEAEVRLQKKQGGRIVRYYKQIRRRNEAIDLEVYALAALWILGKAVREQLGAYADAAAEGKAVKRRRRRRARHGGIEA